MTSDGAPGSDNPASAPAAPPRLLLSDDRFDVTIGPRHERRLSFTLYGRETGRSVPCRLVSDSPWLRVEGAVEREVGEPCKVELVVDPGALVGPAPASRHVAKYAVGRLRVEWPEGDHTVVVRLRLLRRFIPGAALLGVLFGLIPYVGELVGCALVLILLIDGLRATPQEERLRDEAVRHRYFNLSMAVSVVMTSFARKLVWLGFGLPWGM